MPTLDTILALALTVLLPSVGWLVRGVIRHGQEIAALQAQRDGLCTSEDLHKIEQAVCAEMGAIRVQLEALRGDINRLDERSDSIRLVLDRHERFLNEVSP